MIRRVLLFALATGPLVAGVGCHHCCRSKCFDTPPKPYLPPPPGGAFLGPSGRTIPPTSVPTAPGTTFPPPGSVVPDPSNLGTPGDRNFRPGSPDPLTNPPKPAPEVLFPEPLPGGAGRPAFPPSGGPTVEPPVSSSPAPARPEGNPELPGFTKLKEGVAVGQKPTSQGFAVLKQNNYKTVAYLHAPGADTTAARDLAAKQGLDFVAIESSPEKLGEALEKVNGLVAERRTHPVFIYAEDGPRAGAVWYLHFRTVDNDNHDAAKLKAGAQGLDNESPLGKDFWLAIQNYKR